MTNKGHGMNEETQARIDALARALESLRAAGEWELAAKVAKRLYALTH
jgi:hypothetical protein